MARPTPEPAIELDPAARHAHVVNALADAAGTLVGSRPIRVAMDAVTTVAGPALADDLASALSSRGYRCDRASLDAIGYLHHQRPAQAAAQGAALAPNPAAYLADGHSHDLLVVDGSFLQHPEFVDAWDLVASSAGPPARPTIPPLAPHNGRQARRPAARPTARPVVRSAVPATARSPATSPMSTRSHRRPTLRRLLEYAGWLLDRYEDGPGRFLATATRTLLPHGIRTNP